MTSMIGNSQGGSPFPLDCYLSWMSPVACPQSPDGYLKDPVAAKNAWIPAVYGETSRYIHFSHRHIRAALHMKDPATGQAQVRIGP